MAYYFTQCIFSIIFSILHPNPALQQYDLHPLVIQEILDLIKHHQAQKPIIATSTLAYPVMAAAFTVQIRVEKTQVMEI
ncbi:MAG: hypothetical protein ACOX5W_01960 [Bacillota bacterium]